MIIIGEIFSFIAALALGYSTFSNNKKNMMFWQILDSMLNALANVFLYAYSGVVVCVMTALRNVLVAYDKFQKWMLWIFVIFSALLGLVFNNTGLIGILPIIASIGYTICLYIFNDTQKIRLVLIGNLSLWAVYDYTIMSYPMFVMDIIIIFMSVLNYIRFKNVKSEE